MNSSSGSTGTPSSRAFFVFEEFDAPSLLTRYEVFPDDEPRGFQSAEVTLVPDGENCWTWRAEGDNHGMTRKIRDKWYYFEAWL